MKLEEKFVDRMNNILGSSAEDFFSALKCPETKGITLNTTRLQASELEKIADFQLTPIEKVSNGYSVNNFRIGKHPLHHTGAIYSQEPSAMYPAEMLDIRPNEIVLDLCASPGGKSIQILEKLNNTGLLVSNEIVYNRTKILYDNLSRMGFRNFAITCNSPIDYENTDILFDKIIVDAPCGGEGMFRKENFDFSVYSSDNIPTNAKRQLSILNSIKDKLKNGGRLVYSTCTYAIEENESVILNFIKDNPEYHLIRLDGYDNVTSPGIKLDNSNTNFCYRRYPHLHQGEGQFIAVLEKDGTKEDYSNRKFQAKGFEDISNKELQIIRDNLKCIIDIKDLKFVKRNNIYYVLPNTILGFGKLNVTTVGCILGVINKNLLKIDHNFYHTYGEFFVNKIELNEVDTNKYLQGEELDYDGDLSGIVILTYHSIPIGGGKIVNGKIKNYYPKELRN